MKIAALILVLLGSFAAAFPKDCPNVTVIHDVVGDKWYDGCLGLHNHKDKTTPAACEEQCKTDMECSVWQMVKKGDEMHCWAGSVMHGCQSRNSAQAMEKFSDDLVAGQRLQHGFIKLVATNSKTETIGLHHFPETTGTETEQIKRCRQFCETDISCTVWQFGSNGCWIEHGPDHLKTGVSTESEWAKAMIAGETLEHTCPPYKPPEDGLPWPWIIAGIVLGLLALGAIIYALQKKPKVKKTRAVKIEPKPEPPPVVTYFVPQPTVLVPQPTVTYAAPQPTVLVQEPTVTYSAVPQYAVVG